MHVLRAAAVVFDLDGVLVDSEPMWAIAEARTAEEIGLSYTPELRRQLHGRGHRDGAHILARVARRDDGDAVADLLLAHALEAIGGGVPAVDGVVELVEALRGVLPIGVASASPRVVVERELAGLGAFDVVVCGEDVAAAKPAPDPYLEACRRLGVAPADAVAIEDSPAGVASAKAAGLVAVGLDPTGAVNLAAADVVVRSLREVEIVPKRQETPGASSGQTDASADSRENGR